MEKRVYAYNDSEEYLGYVRLSHDDIGQPVGEVYNTEADRLGAIQYEQLDYGTHESLIYDQEGNQIGLIRLETYEGEGGKLGGDIFWTAEIDDDEPDLVAHVQYSPNSERAEVRKRAEWGKKLGSLKPENVTDEELVLVGGGSALLLIL